MIGLALRNTTIKFLHTIGMGKKWSGIVGAGYFSKQWVKMRDGVGSSKSKKDFDILTSAYDRALKLDSLLSPGDEVAIVDMPYDRSIRNIVISDSIDAVVIKKVRKKDISVVELWIVSPSTEESSIPKFEDCLRALLGISYLRRGLVDAHTLITPYIVNPYNSSKTEIVLDKRHRVRYPRLIRNVVQSIDMKLRFPIQSEKNCGRCPASKKCEWSVHVKEN
jgi:hypothetical protein